MENTERSQFTFYRSYYEALKTLPKKDKLAALDAIISYALDGEEIPLNGSAATVFILVKPTLDTGRKKAASGKRGGANAKQTESKAEANAKQTASEKEVEKEREIEIEVEIEDECLRACARGKANAAVAAYTEKVNPTPSAACIDELVGFSEEMGEECVLRAIDIALDEKKTNWAYIRGILRAKLSAGVRSIADWDELERKREQSVKPAGKDAGHGKAGTARDELRRLHEKFAGEAMSP